MTTDAQVRCAAAIIDGFRLADVKREEDRARANELRLERASFQAEWNRCILAGDHEGITACAMRVADISRELTRLAV